MLRIILNESFCSIVMFIDNILLVNVYTVCFSPESKSYGCNTIGNQRMDQEDMHTLDTEEERRSCLCQLYTGFWVITCSGINQRVEVMTQGIPVHILIDAFFFSKQLCFIRGQNWKSPVHMACSRMLDHGNCCS